MKRLSKHRGLPGSRAVGRGLALGLVVGVCAGLVADGAPGHAVQGSAAPAASIAECDRRFAEAPSDRESSLCYRTLGLETPRLHAQAVERLDRLRIEYPEEPWPPFDLAGLLWLESERTPELYRESATRFAARGETGSELRARLGRVRFLMDTKRVDAAREELDRMRTVTEGWGDPKWLFSLRMLDAGWRLENGEVEESHALLEQDRELVLGPPERAPDWLDDTRRQDWLYDMGRVEYELGRHGEAWDLLGLALQSVGDGRPQYRASVLHLLGMVELAAELPSQETRRIAAELFRQELELASQNGISWAEANAHWGLGKLADGEAARAHLSRCIEVGRASQVPDITSLCLAALAAEVAESEPAEARELLARAVDGLATAEDTWSRLHVERETMRVDWATLPREEALRRALETLQRVEEALIEPTGSLTNRARLRSEWFDSSYWLVGRLLQHLESERDEGLDLAFRLLERVRARTLRESLSAESAPVSGVGEAERLVGLKEIARELREDEALLVYQVGFWESSFGEFEGGSWVVVITPSGTSVRSLQGWVELEAPIRKLSRLDDLEALTPLLQRLHRSFVAPALDLLPADVRRLIIVPDGPLHQLPFGALRAQEAASTSLTATYELTLVPSATFWYRWRTGRDIAPPGEPALVLADPDLTGVGVEAPTSTASSRFASAAARGAIRGTDLAPLPHARLEARSVRRHLRGSSLRMGAEASESFLKELPALSDYGVLHLAAHAVIDSKRPERSAVFLAAQGGEDGLLTPAEVAELDLRDRLVVLAACETGAGVLLRAEGVLSLARSFFQAGARTVVASLRNLPDQAAAEVFDDFYRHLAAGASVSEALTAAQRHQLEIGGPTRVWAGIQALGDGDLVPFPGGIPGRQPPLWPWILGAFGLLSGMALVLAIRARRSAHRP